LKPLTVFLLIGGALTLVALTAAKALNNSLNFVIKGLKLGWEGISPTVEISIAIQNTTPASFSINAIIGTVYLNGSKIGDVSNFTAVTVTGVGETIYPIKVRVGLLGVADQVNDIIDIINGSRGIAANLRFVGSVNVANIPYPIDISYNII